MSTLLNSLKKAVQIVLGFIPMKLPTKLDEFNSFCWKICDIYGLPANEESYQHTLATMIMHHKQTSCYKSPQSFASAIKKAQANEVAFEIIQRFNDKKKEAKKQAEATASIGNVPKRDVTDDKDTVQQTAETMGQQA